MELATQSPSVPTDLECASSPSSHNTGRPESFLQSTNRGCHRVCQVSVVLPNVIMILYCPLEFRLGKALGNILIIQLS